MENGINNLKKVDYKVDYIISHCCPTSIQTLIRGTEFKKDILTEYFPKIAEECKFKRRFGHYHDYRQVNSQFVLLYDDIIPLDSVTKMWIER